MQAPGTEGGSKAQDAQANEPARAAETASNVEPPAGERDGSDENAAPEGLRKPESKLRTKLRRARRKAAAPPQRPRRAE